MIAMDMLYTYVSILYSSMLYIIVSVKDIYSLTLNISRDGKS